MTDLFARSDLRNEFFTSAAVGLEMYGCLAKALRIENERIDHETARETDRRARRNLKKQLRRRSRQAFLEATRHFEHDYHKGANLILVTEAILDLSLGFAKRYSERDLSPMDLLHIATIEQFSESLQKEGFDHNVVLIACDRSLKKLAQDRGIDVWDPMHDDPDDLRTPPFM